MKSQATEAGIVTVSNRLPITIRRSQGALKIERSSGGLVAAMGPAMQQQGGTWVGWPGGKLGSDEVLQLDGAYELAPVSLSQTEVRRFYHGFSNRTLWPLFHSLPERAQFERRDWKTYEEVNARFADVVLAAARPHDLIFVHDYHLMRCPIHLRYARPSARIAYFLHIPFPPYDVYRVLPWYREVLRGLLACDLVGFHCAGYAANFLDCVERLLGERVDREGGQIEHGQRTVQTLALPLGIDYDVREASARAARPVFRSGERIVLGVDRLDYTKGIPERIRAFERLLENHPSHREEVTLLQLAVPSRAQVTEYQELKREIDEMVGRVNGRFATSTWTPIRYLYRSVAPDRLAAMYRDAEIGLVTPLRDGMNLVAKEYVASQTAEPGVLVLSRLAGAAERMPESLLVNPYNIDSVAEAIHTGLCMSREDRLARMRALQLRERRNNVHRWMEKFLEAVDRPGIALGPVKAEDFAQWLGEFIDGHRLAVFLDYDGTLAPIARHPSEARPSSEMRKALGRCAERRDTELAVVSGRALADVREILGNDKIVYAGSHGLEIQGPGLDSFHHPDIGHYSSRVDDLAMGLNEVDVDGVWVERKGASLTLHFREADSGRHEEVAELARDRIRAAGFQARDALCAVEARPPIGWDKGHAVLHVLRSRYGPAWSEELRVIYVGDDETDEDAFRSLQGLGATFRVGAAEEPTRARRRLRDVDAVLTLLEWLADREDVWDSAVGESPV